MTRPFHPAPISSLWLVVLVIGLMVGVAATFLSGVFVPPGAPSDATSTVGPNNQILVWVAELVMLGGVAYFVYYRIRNGATAVPTRLVFPILIVILLLVVFTIFVRVNLIAPSTGPGSNGPGGNGITNGTTNGTQGQNASALNLSGGGGGINFFGLGLPAWAAYGILAGAVAVIAIAATIFILRVARGPRFPGEPAPAAGVRSELESAARALEEGSGDPRHILIALYGRLLRRIEPQVGDLTTQTAEEIKSHYLIHLGVQPRTAEEITRLFELARYSSHPIGADEVVLARTVLSTAIQELNSPRAA